MKTKIPSILILAAVALGFAACAPIPGSQPMQPRADVEVIERQGGVTPSETVGQALSARNAVDYANDRGSYSRGWGRGGWGWGGPIPRF